MAIRKDEREFKRWIKDVVVQPAMDRWGRGWSELSPNQREKEIIANAWAVMLGWDRTDRARETRDDADYLALGKSTAQLIDGVNAYLNEHIREGSEP